MLANALSLKYFLLSREKVLKLVFIRKLFGKLLNALHYSLNVLGSPSGIVC